MLMESCAICVMFLLQDEMALAEQTLTELREEAKQSADEVESLRQELTAAQERREKAKAQKKKLQARAQKEIAKLRARANRAIAGEVSSEEVVAELENLLQELPGAEEEAMTKGKIVAMQLSGTTNQADLRPETVELEKGWIPDMGDEVHVRIDTSVACSQRCASLPLAAAVRNLKVHIARCCTAYALQVPAMARLARTLVLAMAIPSVHRGMLQQFTAERFDYFYPCAGDDVQRQQS